ncbi:hypothetical protein E4U42_000244 [Claviceps africana]|uniref:Borealin N-terminal domain-containing protein n=1 Tax=Claviceps africana TaxID=83212 RepID=A0A8K0NJR9_9HYPO|nr:hypothetical protein E4U42_000244 [Claviceps africana]
MAPLRSKKRVSDQSVTSTTRADTKVAIRSPSTPTGTSPIKSRKMGLNAQQKQALIENIQLEITERARRLRAQYQLQAQGLRSRIEIRINRIPMSLRKTKISDLLQKYAEQEQGRIVPKPSTVPAKDLHLSNSQRNPHAGLLPATRGFKRISNEISGDKENDIRNVNGAKKRARVPQADAVRVRPNQVLSPTSSNSRLANRERTASPTKPVINRAGSPLKASGNSRSAPATNVLSSMVERAKATRARGARKIINTSEASSPPYGTTAASRARRNRPAATARGPAARPPTQTGRRPSDTSETSEGSAGTVATKVSVSSKTGRSTAKSTVMGTIRKGVTGGTRRAATKSAATPATTNGAGRTLRKRG